MILYGVFSYFFSLFIFLQYDVPLVKLDGSVTLVETEEDNFETEKEYAFDYLATYILFRMYAEAERLKKDLDFDFDMHNAFEALKNASKEKNIIDGTYTKETKKDLRTRLFSVLTRDIARKNPEEALEYFNLLLDALEVKNTTNINGAKKK